MSPFGEKLPPRKKKKNPGLDFGPKILKSHNLEKQDAS
jgi:hypothetical protein